MIKTFFALEMKLQTTIMSSNLEKKYEIQQALMDSGYHSSL